MQLIPSPRIFVLPHFLSTDECDHLMKLSRPYLQPSLVVDDSKAHGEQLDTRRSSTGMSLYSSDPLVKTIEQRIADLTSLPIENGETIQILHYGLGAEYVPHYDYFNPATPGGASFLERGGQRVATIILYLNTPEAGGETIFPHLGITVTPEKGRALLFYNCRPDGTVDPLTLHGGAPVKAGEKWIATRWIRTEKFQ